MQILKNSYDVKKIVRLDLPFTIDGKTTSFAEQIWCYEIYVDENLVETTEIRKGPLKVLEGMSKEQLISEYEGKVASLESECIKKTTELNNMIADLEA